jgi:uncharacterized protein (TIGR00299 family) protein
VLEVIGTSQLATPAARFATNVFTRLAEAEATVHGVSPKEIHFHEVGALDAIADIVGCGIALDSLGLLDAQIVVSKVAVGQGKVRAAHGILPVPAPAVLQLLKGVPIAAHPAEFELCTPTGAALLTTLAASYGGLPDCVPQRIGVGAGTADPKTHANVLRVVIGESSPKEAAPIDTELLIVETTVDDLDPRLWPDVLAAMRNAGAADAWCAPVLMHKGRPGQVLTVLTPPSYLDAVCQAVFTQTSTLGLRVHAVQRRALPRDRITIQYGQTAVGVKRGLLDGQPITVQPEYEEVRAAAHESGRPVATVLAEIRAQAILNLGGSEHEGEALA